MFAVDMVIGSQSRLSIFKKELSKFHLFFILFTSMKWALVNTLKCFRGNRECCLKEIYRRFREKRF